MTKILKKLKKFDDYVVHVNDYPPIKLQYFCPVSPEIIRPQRAIFGWRLNSSRFGNFEPGSTYFLLSFLGYETGAKNIRLKMGSYGSPTWFSMESARNQPSFLIYVNNKGIGRAIKII